ncbi:filamentous hemagglutinin N-terminal domain-containing protein [Pseudomonas sp. 18175]|uniref:two-partner secretion domain-containing protein n=1 Tax=Pseudomonas sp. 18175 TaxID=3390056 RepID=UPI003D23A2E1
MKIKLTLMALSMALASFATAAPINPVIVNGQVTFTQDGNTLTITNSPNAIINWSSFSIAQGELVRFLQQSSNSSVLNRITGQDPSVILGTLQSNGRVYLINPNGIVFGAGSQINVGGLVASSLAISNADFLAGNRRFSADGLAGQVSNQGAITTPSGGQVYLIAPDVNNTGIITTPQGETVLAAGHSVQLVDSSNPGMHVVVSSDKDQALNLGTVIAQGGNIGIYGALVNQRGTLNANSAVVGQNGKVVLKSSRTTLLEAGSSTTATGVDCGGDIQVLGEQVGVMGNARIDASGQRGGGRVLVGGDYQGKNPAVLNAKQSYVSKDAQISADALASGNGGKIIVWGNDTTRVYGTLSARGGAASGKGGFVETSGHFLDVAGAKVDTRASHGAMGTWQLDPENILVTSFLSGPSASLGDVSAFANNPGTDSEIDADLLSNATSNVLLQATHDITFYTGVANSNSGVSLTAQAGNNINVNSLISFSGDITLAANHNGAGTASGSGKVFTEGLPTAGGRLTITDVDRPPVQTPPSEAPSPSADICTIAPNSALCQVLSPPTASEPVKPVQAASNQLYVAVNTAAPGPDSTTTKPETDTKDASLSEPSVAKNEPAKKMYCN